MTSLLDDERHSNGPEETFKELFAAYPASELSSPRSDSDTGERRSDSGVSTMDSLSGRDNVSALLLSERNNNLSELLDVVQMLRLRSTDTEDQESHSSSLESLDSLDNHQGSQEPDGAGGDGVEDEDEEGGSGSTSCSEDSFEMSSSCSARDTPESSPFRRGIPEISRDFREGSSESFDSVRSSSTLSGAEDSPMPQQVLLRPPPPSSISMDSFMNNGPAQKIDAIRQSINLELSSLDTGLPDLDFEKLEKQLNNAAKEREDHERKLLGEEVRRRLALQVDSCSGATPSVSYRPNRSNLAMRLQSAMNLQVCYMNEMSDMSATESDSEEEEAEEEDSDGDGEYGMAKSRSAPNLKGSCRAGSSKESPEVARLRLKAKERKELDSYQRQTLLHSETKRVLATAKHQAQQTLEQYRRTKSRASEVPRQSRHILSGMDWKEVERVRDVMQNAIAKKNLELVQLLMDRDGLHMEHDSLLVDIEDFTEHETQATALDFHRLIGMQDGDIAPAKVHRAPVGPTYSGSNNGEGICAPSSTVSAPTPSCTPTSPSRSFVSSLTALPALPKSLSKFSLFRR